LKRSLILPLLVALVAAGCAPGSSNTPSKPVKVLGVWSESEQKSIIAVLDAFTAKTGIKVQFESGGRDLDALLSTRVGAGDPPDLAAAPGPAVLTRFANQGKVKDLSTVIDMNKLKSEYAPVWIDLGTIQGKLVQVFSWVAVKGLIWYNPKVFQAKGYTVPKTWDELIALQTKIKASGTTPWCIAIESGGDSGWAGSDFHKELVLGQVGPDIYDKWWQGTQKWTSPEIKSTWTTFGQVLGPNDSNVYGGANQIVNTAYGDVGNPMFGSSPPKCNLINQASFITDFFVKANPSAKAGEDFDFFPMPAANPKYDGARVGAADAWSLFTDSPGAKELVKYLVTAEAQSIWVKRGGKLSPNKTLSLSDYPDEVSRRVAKSLVDTKVFRYDAGDLMPSDMKHAYWTGIIAFIQNQNNLDTILATLDKVQATAYKT
jgi:alpha-glucoside transport system substrate-binding protein